MDKSYLDKRWRIDPDDPFEPEYKPHEIQNSRKYWLEEVEYDTDDNVRYTENYQQFKGLHIKRLLKRNSVIGVSN